MLLIKDKIPIAVIKELGRQGFGNLVKAVVDIEKGIMVIGGELHSDEEALLIETGSEQKNLWGINIYPEANDNEFIEFDSLINLKPLQGNRTRGIDDPNVRQKIIEIVKNLIER